MSFTRTQKLEQRLLYLEGRVATLQRVLGEATAAALQTEAKCDSYRTALAKYINTVSQCEGEDFLYRLEEFNLMTPGELKLLMDAEELSLTISQEETPK